jgi:hypothetical protein
VALRLTQPVTEMSTGNPPACKVRPARKPLNLTAICEPTVYKIWDPRLHTTCGPARPVTAISLCFLSFLRWSGTESTITEATTGLLCQLRMKIDDNKCGKVGGIFGRVNRSTRRKHSQCRFVHHKSYMTLPWLEPGPPRWESGD